MSTRIYKDDIELIKILADEWLIVLDVLEKEILQLEMHPENIEGLNNIFKIVNGIKTKSSFVGIARITRLSYETEYILDAFGKHDSADNNELIDSLLLVVDTLKAYNNSLCERLKEHDSTDKDVAVYLQFDEGQNIEQVFERLKIEREKYEVVNNEGFLQQEQSVEKDTAFDVLKSEEFISELSTEVKDQFFYENSEHMERIEHELLIRLDQHNDDKEAVNELFRAVHSVKGGAGLYLATLHPQSQTHEGLQKYLNVIHAFESLLALIRDRQCSFGKNLVDLSLLVMDYLKSLIIEIYSEVFNDLEDNDILGKITEQASQIQAMESQSVQNTAAMESQSVQNTAAIASPEMVKPADNKSQSGLTQSIRVNQDKLDKMMNTISELIIAKNSFMHISSKLNLEYDMPEMSKEVKQVGAYVNRISDDLQNDIMSIRMVEVKTVFQKMPRVVRDIAQNTGKKMELFMEGEHTEIDKTIVELISDPLVHLIRNSADHGIETIDERLANGKPETGRIVLRAYNKNKFVFIEIEDDGKGIDAEKIKNKVIEKGIALENEVENMNQNQLLNLIFLPGFSMAKQVTEVSGRGVGMDIVKSNISKINGTITIESEVGKGTKMIIRLPLSLAVSRGLIVDVSGDTYIIPLEYIVETVKINSRSIHTFNGKHFAHLRGEAIGIEWLSNVFLTGERDFEKEEINAVIISDGVENYGIVVDKLRNEQEFVVKTLEGHLSNIPGISGSTLLGNGQVVLILNPIDILQLVEK